MFSGHYGIGFLGKRAASSLPLWLLFLAVQFLDVLWAPFVLLGIEKVRIVPHFTRTNALDLYYMPYTHGLVTALLWACLCGGLYHVLARPADRRAGVVLGLAVFSHWVLDLIVHVPDLPLWANQAKVGLGLWNAPALSFGLEAVLLLGAIWLCVRDGQVGWATVMLGAVLLSIQCFNTFIGPPPSSDHAFAWTALGAYVAFAAAIWWVADRRRDAASAPSRTP